MSIGGTLKAWNTAGTSINISGGTLSVGALDSSGNPSLFNWTGGTINLTNSATIDSNFALGSSITLTPAMALSTSATLLNNGQITLAGGALSGTGALVNGTGQISGFGTIAGSGGFTNNGVITQGGGALTLSNLGANSNTGDIELTAGNQFQLTGGNLANTGTINLNGATITGGAQLTNSAAGVIAGPGTISTPLTNSGTIATTSGTLNLPAFTNNGIVAPSGVTANMSGGAIANASTIQGFGKMNNNVTNTGTIEAAGGTLIFTGSVANNAGGLITASSGNKLLFTSGLSPNSGLISLTGGTIDTNGTTFTNNAIISGYGVLRAGNLNNNSQITLTGGTTTISGPVANNSGARIDVRYGAAVFNGAVANNAGATIKTTGANVSFVGPFTNNGTYNSDPSTNYFTDLSIGSSGYLTGGAGDNFYLSGNFTNNSTQTGSWNTSGALLGFNGGASHQLNVAGSAGQFGWGTLQVNSGDTVTVNGNSVTAAATVNNGSLSHVAGTSSLGSLTGTGSLSVGNSSGGAAAVTVSAFNQSSISVNTTGTLTVAHSSTPAINSTNSLTIVPGGKLDLTNSTLFIHYTPGADPFSTIVGYLRSGYDNGLWDGSGVISTTAAANAAHTTAISIVDSADGLVSGLPANTIELKYVLYGDTGLSGSVGFNDFTRLTQHYGQSSGVTWDVGDFNYDGSVNLSDFLLMTRTYNTSLGATAVGAIDAVSSSVPEPSAVMLGLAGLPLLRRRRRWERR
jgi:MYXO-CTERM domain-containing protein